MNRSTSFNASISGVKSGGNGLFLTEPFYFDVYLFLRLRWGEIEIVGCIVLAINGERLMLLFLLFARAF